MPASGILSLPVKNTASGEIKKNYAHLSLGCMHDATSLVTKPGTSLIKHRCGKVQVVTPAPLMQKAEPFSRLAGIENWWVFPPQEFSIPTQTCTVGRVLIASIY